jgi:hypothetical protein
MSFDHFFLLIGLVESTSYFVTTLGISPALVYGSILKYLLSSSFDGLSYSKNLA